MSPAPEGDTMILDRKTARNAANAAWKAWKCAHDCATARSEVVHQFLRLIAARKPAE